MTHWRIFTFVDEVSLISSPVSLCDFTSLSEKLGLSYSATIYGGLCLFMGSARVNPAVLFTHVEENLEVAWSGNHVNRAPFGCDFFLQLGVVVAPHALKLPEEPITQRGEYWCEVTVSVSHPVSFFSLGRKLGLDGVSSYLPH